MLSKSQVSNHLLVQNQLYILVWQLTGLLLFLEHYLIFNQIVDINILEE